MATNSFNKLVPKPTKDSINTGVEPLHQATVMRIFGAPSATPKENDSPITNKKLLKSIVTDSVGPFRVTGHKCAINSLKAILAEVKINNPALYATLGTAGMLNARLVRGSTTAWSNHSFGCSIDFLINGQLDTRGDNQTQQGLLDLYPYFHKAGWYWGAGFPTEDSMHFEVGNALMLKWESDGLL